MGEIQPLSSISGETSATVIDPRNEEREHSLPAFEVAHLAAGGKIKLNGYQIDFDLSMIGRSHVRHGFYADTDNLSPITYK